MKKINYLFQALLFLMAMAMFKVMPLDIASATGGWIARTLGPFMRGTRTARYNLGLAFPNKSEEEYKAIITGMWDNLGRVMGEYPHLNTIRERRTEFRGRDIVEDMRHRDGPALLIAAHLGNWEIPLPVISNERLDVDFVYRAPNNPYVDTIIKYFRRANDTIGSIPKSRQGMKQIIQSLQAKRIVGMVIDSKYNEGIPVPFFGHPAMTSDAFVVLARKYNCPVYPIRTERTKGANFICTLYPAFDVHDTDTVEQAVSRAHALLESWITERPEQWFWLHRRWPGSKKNT